jgi:hypothetical protein
VPSAKVIVDDGPGKPDPWRGYQRCLEDLPAAGHLVVLQDDCLPCLNFEAALEHVIAARSDDVISLFVGGLGGVTRKQFFEASRRGSRWSAISFRDIHHVVALIWPIERVRQFFAWKETAKIPGHRGFPRSDDAIVGTWARQNKVTVWATVPSLVEHPDDLASSIGRRASQGRDRGRVAIQYIGDDDPLELDWSAV